MNIQDVCSYIKGNYGNFSLSLQQVRKVSRLPYNEIIVDNVETESFKFFLIVSKFSRISKDTKILLNELLDLLDLLLTRFNFDYLRSSDLNFDFSSLNILILARIQNASIDGLLNAVIRLTGHQLEELNEVISVLCTKLSFEMAQIFSNLDPRTLNKYLRLVRKALNIPELSKSFRTHCNIFVMNSSKYLINQYETENALTKTERRIQKKVKDLAKFLEINLSERFKSIPVPSRRSKVVQEIIIEKKVALYSRIVQNYYDLTIYRVYEQGMYKAIKEYSKIFSLKAGKMIAKEIEIMQKLSTDARDDNCFIQVYEVKNNENMISIVMDYFELDLKKKIQSWKQNNIKPSELEILTLISKLIQSFAELQEKKIFHRDIKPQNILITPNNQPKIIDFNISYKRQLNELTISIQQASIVGTLNYMAPELLEFYAQHKRRGEFNIGKADVFSLGITFWELISLEEMNGMCTEKSIKQLLADIESSDHSPWIKSLLDSMLRLNPKERKSFKELLIFFDSSETIMSTIQNN